MKNWKTTTGGIIGILGALAIIGKALLGDGGVSGAELTAAFASLGTGISLLFAKDANVTGGTVASTVEAEARIDSPPSVAP